MTQKIKNMNDLAKALEPKIKATLELVAEDVKKEIDDALQRYYDDYDPAFGKLLTQRFYQRTYQLRDCCKIRSAKIDGKKLNVQIYLDINSLEYSTKGADPYKTVVAANAGLHGGWDIDDIPNGQIPWSAISDNSGSSYGSGTQIWEEPIKDLIDGGKFITLFKKHAKARGLNIT